MDVLRCVACSRSYYTPSAESVLANQPTCTHCGGALALEGRARIDLWRELGGDAVVTDHEEPAESLDAARGQVPGTPPAS